MILKYELMLMIQLYIPLSPVNLSFNRYKQQHFLRLPEIYMEDNILPERPLFRFV